MWRVGVNTGVSWCVACTPFHCLDPCEHPSTELTAFRGDIYTNPDLKVYHALGMDMESTQTTPSTERKCSYRTTSMFTNGLFSGVTAQIRSSRSRLIGGQGPPMQLGGDFVFGPGVSHHSDLSLFSFPNRAGMSFSLENATYRRPCVPQLDVS